MIVAEDNRSRESIYQRLIHHKKPEESDIGPNKQVPGELQGPCNKCHAAAYESHPDQKSGLCVYLSNSKL